MYRLSTLAALTVASLCAGCAVGPDYARPEVSLPKAYMGAQAMAPAAAVVDAAAQKDLSTWWAGFNDAQLTRFVALALQKNLDLAQASARMLQARAGLDASSAALLPVAQVAAQTARSYQSVETPLGQVLNSSPGFNRYGSAHEANLGVSWEADLFGGLRRARQASWADYQAAEAGAVALRLAVAAQAADTYLHIRGLQARLAVARQQADTQQQLRSIVDLRWQKGLAAERELSHAQADLARARAAVPLLQAALETAMNAMDVLLGASPGTYRAELRDVRPLPVAPRMALAQTPADLLRRRPDVIAAERRLAASNARIGMAMAEYYPKVSISGLLGSATAIASGNLFTQGASQASAVVGLRWRLFDFGRINAQIDNAQAQEAEALAAYRQAILRATEDVENALLSLDNRYEQSAELASGAGALERARAFSAAAYAKGVLSQAEVLQADERLLAVVDAQIQADVDATRSAVMVFKALGGGWTPDQPSVVAHQP